MRVIRALLIALAFMCIASPPADAACPAGQEHWTDGGCYRKCPEGATRTGPASCQIPSLVTNCTDYGLSGSAPTGTSCPAGQDYYGWTCYKGCPSGSTRTAACTCDKVPVNNTSELLYGRAGPPLPCTPSANISTSQPLDITFYVTSDTHFHTDSFDADTHQGHVLFLNRMKDVKWPLWQGFVGSASGLIGAPSGVIINGDYTNYGHEKELGIFREFYERGRKRSDLPIWIQGDPDVALPFFRITTPIDYPTWVGFGNHELMGDGGPERNRAYIASKMAIGCGDVVNQDSYTSAYSWNWGRLHLIQVNALGDDRKPTGFDRVMTWLAEDLFRFAKDGQPVIVFSHYALRGTESAKNLNGTYLSSFIAAFAKYNVIAMFAGHDHEPDLDDVTSSFPVFRSSTGGQVPYKVPSGAHVVHVTDNALDVAYFEWCPNGRPTTCAKNQSCPHERCAAPAPPYTGGFMEPTYNAAYSMHKNINGMISTAESFRDNQSIDVSNYAPATGGECDEPPLACPAGSNLYGTWVGGFCCYGATDGNTCSTGNMCALDPTRPQNQRLCCPTGMNLYGTWAGGFCCAGAVSSDGQTCTTGEVCALDPSRTQGFKLCTSLRCPVGMTFYGASKGGFCCKGTVSTETCSTSDVCALDANRTQGNRVCRSQCVARGPGCNTSIASGQCGFPASNAVEMCRAHPQCTALNCNKSMGWCFARDQTHMGSWSGMAGIIVRKDIPAGPFQDQAINCGPGGCISSGPGCDTSAVPGQCSFPKKQAVALCSQHPKCVAVSCNQTRSDCQARDTLERSPWRGMNSTLLTNPLVDQAINCGPNGCLASGPGCDVNSVPGQCTFPKESALELCRKHPQCKAVICNSLRKDCQARDVTDHVAWPGYTSYILDRG